MPTGSTGVRGGRLTRGRPNLRRSSAVRSLKVDLYRRFTGLFPLAAGSLRSIKRLQESLESSVIVAVMSLEPIPVDRINEGMPKRARLLEAL